MGKTKRYDKRAGAAHKKSDRAPSPQKAGRPKKRGHGTVGARNKRQEQAPDAYRLSAWARTLTSYGSELVHRRGETWSYDAIRLFLWMIVVQIQQTTYSTWQGAKEAVTTSMQSVHQMTGCSMGVLEERWRYWNNHRAILEGDPASRGSASAPLIEELRQLSAAHYAEVLARDGG